jgi:hypothetical protein
LVRLREQLSGNSALLGSDDKPFFDRQRKNAPPIKKSGHAGKGRELAVRSRGRLVRLREKLSGNSALLGSDDKPILER